MQKLLRRRPSPAMTVACFALLVALGGTSIAAVSTVPRGSVGTPQLRNGAVTTAKVRNRSLRAVDFARGQLPRGPVGPAGPAGSKGDKGDKGDPGAAGTARAWARVSGAGALVDDANVTSVTKSGTGVYCVIVEQAAVADMSKAGAIVTPFGGSGQRLFASALPGGCDTRGVQVQVWNQANTLVDAPFAVAVP